MELFAPHPKVFRLSLLPSADSEAVVISEGRK